MIEQWSHRHEPPVPRRELNEKGANVGAHLAVDAKSLAEVRCDDANASIVVELPLIRRAEQMNERVRVLGI